MNVQILKLFLVRRDVYQIHSYDFMPDKLNVIVGRSAKGKSTVWSIIDYICHANECDVDAKIAKCVGWVGLVLKTEEGNYAFARELAIGEMPNSSSYFYKHLEDGENDVMAEEICANVSSAKVKELLDRLVGVKSPLGIRELLDIIGQNYDVVSNEKHLFNNRSTMSSQKLAKYFPSVIGFDGQQLADMEAEKRIATDEKERKEHDVEVARNVADEWQKALSDNLREAKGLQLLDVNATIPADTSECLDLAKTVLSDFEKNTDALYNVDKLGELSDAVFRLKSTRADIELKLVACEDRISELNRLKLQIDDYARAARDESGRLRLVDWMIANWSDYQTDLFNYPYAHGRSEQEVRGEIDRLKKSLAAYEETVLKSKNVLAFRDVTLAELQNLTKRKDSLIASRDLVLEEIKALEDERGTIRDYEACNNRMHQLVGEMRRTVELIDRMAKNGEAEFAVTMLSQKIVELTESITVAKKDLDSQVQEAVQEIADEAFRIAKAIGLNDSFEFAHVSFDVAKLDLLLGDVDGNTYLRSRKSAANHSAFHIGITAALENFCAKRPLACLPSFVVYDQPAQGRGEGDERFSPSQCIQAAVSTLSQCVKKTVEECGRGWQPILIDACCRSTVQAASHGDYHLVADLDELNGLVPTEWMQGR